MILVRPSVFADGFFYGANPTFVPMDYNQTLDYLYNRLPMFSRIGAAAYKKDLHNTIQIHLRPCNLSQKSIHYQYMLD